jgi:hypothetical protein
LSLRRGEKVGGRGVKRKGEEEEVGSSSAAMGGGLAVFRRERERERERRFHKCSSGLSFFPKTSLLII